MNHSKSVIVIGGGGHARVLIDALQCMKTSIIGVVDPQKKTGDTLLDVPILGNDEFVFSYSKDEVYLVNGIGSTQNTQQRQQIFDKFKSHEYHFANVFHPTSIIASDVQLGEGIQIMAGAVIQTGSIIQDNTIINTQASIDHECLIGKHVHIAPGVVLSGGVQVGNRTHVGTGAVIIQSIRIGENSLIGAGALVRKEVLPGKKIIK